MRDKIAVIGVGVTSFVMGSLVTRRSCNKELNAFEAEKEDIRDLAKNTEIIERIHSIRNKSVRICQLNQFNRLVAEALSARDMKSLNKSVEEINVFFRSLKELTSESYHVDEEITDGTWNRNCCGICNDWNRKFDCNQYDAGISGTDKGNERRIDDSYAYNSVYDTFGGGSFF